VDEEENCNSCDTDIPENSLTVSEKYYSESTEEETDQSRRQQGHSGNLEVCNVVKMLRKRCRHEQTIERKQDSSRVTYSASSTESFSHVIWEMQVEAH
jgi:sulfatase maturation enzyme AslB (radical SAM superfamily)